MYFSEKLIYTLIEIQAKPSQYYSYEPEISTIMYLKNIHGSGFNTRTEREPKDPSIKTVLSETVLG